MIQIPKSILQNMRTQNNESVSDISHQMPVMLVFMRHLGCIFCQEALADLKKVMQQIESSNIRVVFVHMSTEQEAEKIFARHDLTDMERISDMENTYYNAFGLVKGDFRQIFGFKSWLGMGRAYSKGIRQVRVQNGGDPHQMPGIFIIKNEKVIKSFQYRSVGDYPDYLNLIKI